MWVSGRKLRVVGLSGPEIKTSVPVSATPAKAHDSEDFVGGPGRAGLDLEAGGAFGPRQPGEQRILAVAQARGQIVAPQVVGHQLRDVGGRPCILDGRLDRLGLGAEQLDLAGRIEAGAPWHQVAGVIAQPHGHRLAPVGFVARHAEGAADAAEHGVARIVSHCQRSSGGAPSTGP
jgi:hypothetical protein